MKKIILTNFFLACICFTMAQTTKSSYKIQEGPLLEVSKRSTMLTDFIGHDVDGFYCLEQIKRKLLFTKYDDNMKLLRQNELLLKYENKNMYYQMSLILNNNLMMFTSYDDSKAKKYLLFSQTVDKKNLTPQGDYKRIAEIDYSNHSRWNMGSYSYDIASEKEFLLVYYDLPYEKNSNERYGLIMYDKNLNMLWNNEVALPYKDKECFIVSFMADNNGGAHLLCRIKKEKEQRKNEKDNYEYHILSYMNNGKDFKEIVISPQDKVINEIKIGFNKQNNIICAGFYSDQSSSGIKGACFMMIDPASGRVIYENYKEVASEVLTLDVTDKEKAEKIKAKAEKKARELYNYSLDHLILREDGGAVLIAEKFYITTYTYTTMNANGSTSTRTVYVYHYDDIIVVNIDPQRKIDWIKKISKYQQSENDGGFYLSYVLGVVKDKLYFVYNSNQKEVMNQDVPGSIKGSSRELRERVIAICEIDMEGKETTEVLMRGKDLDVYIRPKSCQQITDNELILYGLRRKSRQFIKVIFD